MPRWIAIGACPTVNALLRRTIRDYLNSGQAEVKPAGLKILIQVSNVLTNVTDKQMQIEGHTDNVPIGVNIREKCLLEVTS